MKEWEFTLDMVPDALNHIDSEVRDTWFSVACALKAEFGDVAYDEWDYWSSTGSTYNERDARAVWKSIRHVKRYTIGTLIHLAKQGGWRPPRVERSPEEVARFRAEQAERRRLAVERQQLAEQEERDWHERIARLSTALWGRCSTGFGAESPYLEKKQVNANGVRFITERCMILVDDNERSATLLTDASAITDVFEREKAGQIDHETTSYRYLVPGTLVVPMWDIERKLWGLQFIFSGGAKKFIKNGRKQGCFAVVGSLREQPSRLLFAEGYATAASLHMATCDPVVVTFDCGNIRPVAEAFRGVYPNMQFVICGDNDEATPGNPGKTKALEAAKVVHGVAVFPEFEVVA